MNVEVTRDEIIIKDNSEQTHENEYNITTCYFTFDEFTNSFQNKYAVFTMISNGETYQQDIINNQCEIPAEVLKHEYETVKLGVFGENIDTSGTDPILENRFSPSYTTFIINTGSYKEGAITPEIITPSQYEIYSAELQEGLDRVDDKIEEVDDKLGDMDDKIQEVDDKLDVVDGKINDVDEAIEKTNNLNLDVSDKVDGDVTVTLTKKDASTKTVVLSDGTSLEFNWDGTKLGIKTEDEEEYTYVDLQGIQGPAGPQGEAFRIKKTYSSVAEMNADFNNMEYGDYVMIASSVEVEDNAKLYTRGESAWIFITDFSGATGIRGPVGPTPNIQVGTVTSGSTPSVTRSGTDENPVLNFVLQKGDTGSQGPTGPTGNGIASITKTGTSGLVDTYTITFTNSNTTTFQVTNGKGITNIQKTATSGLVDTYTITYNDGTTSTYEVTNGEDGEVTQEEFDRLKMIYNILPTTSEEDTEITLNGTGEMPFKSIDLKGNTTQESTTGKNKLPYTLANLKTDNVAGTWNDNVYTFNGVTFTINEDLTISTTGTASATSYLLIANTGLGLTGGTEYILNGCPASGTTSTYSLRIYDSNNTYKSDTGTGYTFTYSDQVYVRINISNGINSNGLVFRPMIRLSTVSDSSYEPYTGGSLAPSPSYPYPVQVVSGNNSINVEGKNLINVNDTSDSLSNQYYKNYETGYTLEPNVTYTLSLDAQVSVTPFIITVGAGETGYVRDIYAEGGKQNGRISLTFTPTSENLQNATKLFIRCPRYNSATTTTYTLKNIQLEKGTTESTYTPYVSQTYPINLGSIELCKIGTYQDYIYKQNGNWYKYGAIGKVVLDGSENWSTTSTANQVNTKRYSCSIIPHAQKNTVSNTLCDTFTRTTNPTIDEENIFYAFYGTEGTYLALRVNSTNASDLATFKTWLSTHNTTVYYVLNTPTYTKITDSTLVSQLNNLEKAISYDTQTNISQTNNDMPFIINAEAFLSLKNILN